MQKDKIRVLTGLSGGVDSAVCACILKEKGYDVVAAMMKTYSGENIANSCYGSDKEKEIEDAKAICKKLDIDFHIIDCTKEYDAKVFKPFRNDYKKGITPNPCVICNPEIKFGVFPKLAHLNGIEFEKFATGHYARIEEKEGRFLLKKGFDNKKDQSYFLYRLSQEQLSKTIFPLGEMKKDDVRLLAKNYGFDLFDKKDSQDFYDGNYSDILNIEDKKGQIVTLSGEILGEHNGIHHFTIGQRKGLKIAYKAPLYVIELDAANNKVIVGTKNETFSKNLIAKNINWVAIDKLDKKIKATCKHRSVQTPHPCTIEPLGDKIRVTFEKEQTSITKGQSAVFYDDDAVLCGGFIE